MNALSVSPSSKLKTLEEILAFFRAQAADLKARHHLTVEGIFGSYARSEQDQDSDVDVLVSLSRIPSLWEWIAIEGELSERLGVRVHLVHNDSSPAVCKIKSGLVRPISTPWPTASVT